MKLTRAVLVAGVIALALSGCIDPQDESLSRNRAELDRRWAEFDERIRQEYKWEHERHERIMQQLNSPAYVSPSAPLPIQPHFSQPPVLPHSYITGQGHWIDEVMADGEVIKLEDGSLWNVAPIDTVDSQIWLPVTSITVIEGEDPEFTYKLVNTDDNEVVNARLISR